MSNNNADISSGMVCCHGYKNRSFLQFMKFLSPPRAYTFLLSLHAVCSQIQRCDSSANEKSLYRPFSGTSQQAAFYNNRVEKIKNKGGGEITVTQPWHATTVHFPLLNAVQQANVRDWHDRKHSF